MKKRILFLAILLTALLILDANKAKAADVEAVLDSADGSSAFTVKDSASTIQGLIDSDGNMVIKGGLRLDSAGTKCTTAENLIVDGKIGVANSNPNTLLHLGLSGTTLGTIGLAGSTSGFVTIQPAASAGTWTLTLPSDDGEDGQFLRTNGSGVTNWATPSGDGTIPQNIQVFTSSGTWVKPAGVSKVYVQVWGAGGGGNTGAANQSGGGGGGGGYCAGLVSVSGNVTVTVGTGGGAGAAGGNSSFAGNTTLTANGGSGGGTTGGNGGTASGGTINITGGNGGSGRASDGAGGGSGGGSPFGGAGGSGGAGANASNPNTPGTDGCVPGGGGGGGAEQAGTGGAGANGLVIVMY